MNVIHKKLNKSRFSVCGIECRPVFDHTNYRNPDAHNRSYFWKDVNCPKCLNELKLIKTEIIRKHNIHKSKYSFM